MGLHVNVYRKGSDCTNVGISSKYDTLLIENVSGPFNESDEDGEYPVFILEKGAYNSIRLVPKYMSKKHHMFGGNYAGTSDSRFGEAVEAMVGYNFDMVKIFDRVE